MDESVISGAELRRRRHSLGLTLEEASRGICSVAYLSLIEQGQREPSERMVALLAARLTAAESDSGIAVQLTALKIAELELRQSGTIAPETRGASALKPHLKLLEALEAESRGELGCALSLLEEWLSQNDNARDLRSFGARIRVRLLRASDRDPEAVAYAAKILASSELSAKSRQDDLLEIAFQLASLYSAAGAWRDAIAVLEAQSARLTEPKQVVNALWAKSDALYARGDVEAALQEASAALGHLEHLDLPVAQAKLAANVIWYQLLSNQIDELRQRKTLSEIESVLREASSADGVASTLSTLALLEARLGNRDAMLKASQLALSASLNTASRAHAELLVSLGEIGMTLGEKTLALAALDNLSDSSRATKASRAEANLLHRAGNLCNRLGDTVRANVFFAKALALMGFVSVSP